MQCVCTIIYRRSMFSADEFIQNVYIIKLVFFGLTFGAFP